ncbi:guanylyltransferase [bacterium]|nr:guanylyltransferase [bacterium]
MKFDDFDEKMRKFEQSIDQTVPQDCYMVARLDGKGFTKLTKEKLSLKRPFDETFRDAIIQTIYYLMDSDFDIAYAYSESDEISLLFRKNTNLFGRKVRKYNSLLSAEASVKFSQLMNTTAVFDCRIIPLLSVEDVKDYFLWRREDSHRNSVYAHCFYKLLSDGKTPAEAEKELSGKILDEKEFILSTYGINLNSIPKWEIYGFGVYFKTVEKVGFNPVKNERETTTRKKLFTDFDLPSGQNYAKFIEQFVK